MVAFTSEFWYDDEEEFDAITETLEAKRVVLATPEQAAAPPAALKSLPFVTAFASPDAAPAAERLWQELGRAGGCCLASKGACCLLLAATAD